MTLIQASRLQSPSEYGEQHRTVDASGIALRQRISYIQDVIVSLIAAVSDNGVIGRKNALPWHLPAELQYFRAVTQGKPVIMGRKTHESIGRLLPKRHNIIVSRNPGFNMEGADTVSSVDDALALAEQDGLDEAFIIGGGQVYEAALPKADRLYLTKVHTVIEDGEAFFPAFDEHEWDIVKSERHEADEENPVPYTTMVYERKK